MTWAGETTEFGSGLYVFTSDGSPGEIVGNEEDVILWRSGLPEFVSQSELTSTSGIGRPGSSTDNALIRWDGIDASTIQDSFVTVDDSGTITMPGGQIVNGRITSAISVIMNQLDWLLISTATQQRTVFLPPSPNTWQSHNIKDGAGNAKNKKLIIDGNGNTIDGCSKVTINGKYKCFTVVFNGAEWRII